MTKKSVKLLAMMVALLLMLSGCSLIAVDPAKDAAEAIVKVNDRILTKGDVQTDFNTNVAYTAMMYANFGLPITMEEAEAYVRESYMASMLEQLVQLEKASELGLDQFTEEEEAEFQAAFEEEWAVLLESYELYANVTDDMTEEERMAAILEVVEGYGITRESYEKNLRDTTITNRVYEQMVADVSVPAADIQTAYDEKVSAQETSYADNHDAFEQAVINGEMVVWYPEGYRTVLHILLGYEEEVAAEMTELQIELDEIDTRLTEAEANGGELVLAEGEEDVTVESLTARKGEIENRMAEVEAQFLADNQATVDEIMQRYADGEDIRTLIAEYGEDAGVAEDGVGYEKGYYVSADSVMWDPNFTQGAMALETVGQLSEPVFTPNGLHLIYYMADVVPGAVPMSEVSEALEEELLYNAQSVVYSDMMTQWMEEYEIKTWPERLVYTGE